MSNSEGSYLEKWIEVQIKLHIRRMDADDWKKSREHLAKPINVDPKLTFHPHRPDERSRDYMLKVVTSRMHNKIA